MSRSSALVFTAVGTFMMVLRGRAASTALGVASPR